MNKIELIKHLNEKGLRIAGLDEAGWTYTYMDSHRERITVRVTDA